MLQTGALLMAYGAYADFRGIGTQWCENLAPRLPSFMQVSAEEQNQDVVLALHVRRRLQ